MAIRAKRNRLFKVTEEARIGNGVILERGDRILVLREDEIPNIPAEETRDPENDVGYGIVDDAADDFSSPTQESRLARIRRMERARALRRRAERARRSRRWESIVIDEEDELPSDEFVDGALGLEEEEEEDEGSEKVEERYARILRRREAMGRATGRSMVERRMRMARAKREMARRRGSRFGR